MYSGRIIASVLLLFAVQLGNTQSDDCNALGVWLWHIESTGFSHELLANNLAANNIKRIYVKVADGRVDSSRWSELIDKNLIQAYKNKDINTWAWSYNYKGNYQEQAEALYVAAQTGYQGYVVDVEMEFDGEAATLDSLFAAFYKAREAAITDGHIDQEFRIYCTTWGNPKDHNFSIASIDPYVDGYMPQTYVEYWGPSHLDNITYWVEEGNREYAELGATKPNHHIVSTATGVMTSELINEFISASGPETSLWRVPGGGVPFEVWEDWNSVNWTMDFCEPTVATEIIDTALPFRVYPNPTTGRLYFDAPEGDRVSLFDGMGRLVEKIDASVGHYNLSESQCGLYFIHSDITNTTLIISKN